MDVSAVVTALDGNYAEFGAAFSAGNYTLWLGSGISRDVVPGVDGLLEQTLELLRSNIDLGATECPFRSALNEVLSVAGVPAKVIAAIDLSKAVGVWAERDDIIERLQNHYSDVLDTHPSGQDADYLVWTGLDVPNAYGDPALMPDAEHTCVAILMLEGVVRNIQTTNWDGLIEAALAELTPNPDSVMRVVVAKEDFSLPERRADMLKFHGCAVRARTDESAYRHLLIARASQISGWTTRAENQLMKDRLQYIYATNPALVIGLSAQDANIHTVFNQAIENLNHAWPSTPPGVVIANGSLGHHHKLVLRVTYGDAYAPNDTAINAASHLAAYAKPTLAGLVLYVLADKLRKLLAHVPGIDPAELPALEQDLLTLRDAVAAAASDERGFVQAVVDAVTLASHVFRRGCLPASGQAPYLPLSARTIEESILDSDFPTAALARLALVFSLVSRAQSLHGWEVRAGSVNHPRQGTLSVTTNRGLSRLFVVRDTREAIALGLAGYAGPHPASAVVIHASGELASQTRSPRSRYGRTGRLTVRRISMDELIKSAGTADELLDSFAREGVF